MGFEYTPQEYRFLAIYEEGYWSEGKLVTDDMLYISEMSPAIHYGQQCFEGLKAFSMRDGKIALFRPHDHYTRLNRSCSQVLIPEIPEWLFMKACS